MNVRKGDRDASEAEVKVSSKILVNQLNYIEQVTACQLLNAASSQED